MKIDEFDLLADGALDDAEIQQSIQGTGLDRALLKGELIKRKARIIAAVSAETALEEKAERQWKAAVEKLEAFSFPLPRWIGFLNIIYWGGGALLVIAVTAWWFDDHLPASIRAAIFFPTLWGLVAFSLGFALLACFHWLANSRFKSKYALAKSRAEKDHEIARWRDEWGKARDKVASALLAHALLPELRTIINSERTPDYSLVVRQRTSPGLSEVFQSSYEIPTDAKSRLMRTIETMPGGSIGVAGPRGSGKSTLLFSICQSANRELKGRPVCSVFTSAPVKYDAREFILHLFSSLCHAVLGITANSEGTEGEENHSYPPPSQVSAFREIAQQVILPLSFVGGLLLWLGMTMTFLLSQVPSSPPPSSQTPKPPQVSGVSAWLKASDLKPATFLTSGLLLLGVACGLALPRFMRRSRLSRIDRKPIVEDAAGRFGEAAAQFAEGMLREIRFQRSYSSGWSGSLKLPVGLEGSINSALSMAERQRTLPEIVASYKRLLSLVAGGHTVVIGIDELDKLQTDEMAQQFLNEIKSIFGLDYCFYIISISENAISAFERRGLPFRDAFDSAFDTVVHLDYLTLENAKRLLRRRVIGLEVPAICLSYCISGGLPRDLIRACRDILEAVVRKGAELPLSEACAAVMLPDIRAKLAAIVIAARQLPFGPGVSTLMDRIGKIEFSLSSAPDFLTTFFALPAVRYSFASPDSKPSDATSTNLQRTTELAIELHTYLYFAATLLQIFNDGLAEVQLRRMESGGVFEMLARARQNFAVNPLIALGILEEARTSASVS